MRINVQEEIDGLEAIYKGWDLIEKRESEIGKKRAQIIELETKINGFLKEADSCQKELNACNSSDSFSVIGSLMSKAGRAKDNADKLQAQADELRSEVRAYELNIAKTVQGLVEVAEKIASSAREKKQLIATALREAPDDSELEKRLLDFDNTLNMAIFASSHTLKALNTKKNTSDSEWGDN